MMMIDRSIDREVYTVQSWQLGNRHDRKSVQYQTHGSYLGRMKGRGESPTFKGVLLASTISKRRPGKHRRQKRICRLRYADYLT